MNRTVLFSAVGVLAVSAVALTASAATKHRHLPSMSASATTLTTPTVAKKAPTKALVTKKATPKKLVVAKHAKVPGKSHKTLVKKSKAK